MNRFVVNRIARRMFSTQPKNPFGNAPATKEVTPETRKKNAVTLAFLLTCVGAIYYVAINKMKEVS